MIGVQYNKTLPFSLCGRDELRFYRHVGVSTNVTGARASIEVEDGFFPWDYYKWQECVIPPIEW